MSGIINKLYIKQQSLPLFEDDYFKMIDHVVERFSLENFFNLAAQGQGEFAIFWNYDIFGDLYFLGEIDSDHDHYFLIVEELGNIFAYQGGMLELWNMIPFSDDFTPQLDYYIKHSNELSVDDKIEGLGAHLSLLKELFPASFHFSKKKQILAWFWYDEVTIINQKEYFGNLFIGKDGFGYFLISGYFSYTINQFQGKLISTPDVFVYEEIITGDLYDITTYFQRKHYH